MQDVLARFVAKHGTNWELLPEKAMFQMNDTHPTIAVAELMRVLVDEHKVAWDTAKFTTIKCLAFTNHTVMPEALERWPFEVMTELLPRHAQIIERLDLEWCAAAHVCTPRGCCSIAVVLAHVPKSTPNKC